MAVGFDAVAPGSTPAAGTTSLSWSHTCVAGATHLLVAAVLDAPNDSGMTMSATYNSVAMTSLGIWHTGGSTAGFLQVWSMASPPTGSALTVSVTSTGSPTQMEGGSLSFTGSSALSAVQATVSSGAQINPSGSFTGAVSGNMVAGFCGAGSALTQTGSFTNRFNGGNAVNGAGFIAGSTIASSGTVTDSFTMSPADFWAVALVEVQAAAGAAVPSAVARPGKTWLRRFHHRQRLPVPFTAPAAAVAVAAPEKLPPVPRRAPSRARIGGRGLCAAGIAVAAVIPVAPEQRPAQPARPAPSRAHAGPQGRNAAGIASPVVTPLGTPGPSWRAQPRRPAPARAVWRGYASQIITPRGTPARRPGPQIISRPRSRAVWHGGTGTLPVAVTQPPRWRPLPARRKPQRVVWRVVRGLVNLTVVPPQFGQALASGQAATLTTTAGAPPQPAGAAGTAGTVTVAAGTGQVTAAISGAAVTGGGYTSTYFAVYGPPSGS